MEKKNNLPVGWIIAKMGTITKSKKIGLDRSRIGQSDLGIPYLKMNNITINGTLDLKSLTHIQCTEQEEMDYALEYGDIVFNTRNSYELVGKTAFWNGIISKCVYNNNIMRIRAHDIISPKFLVYFMNSIQFRNSLLSIKRATTNICAIYDTDLKEQNIPIPPLNEQKRIALKIEELFSKIHFSQKSLENVKIHLKQYRQSILKHAFEGKLTDIWRNNHLAKLESANKILKRISTNEKTQKPIETTNLPNLPNHWIWTNIDVITNFLGSGITPSGGRSVYVEKGIPFIRSQNVFFDGLKLDNVAYVTKEMHERMTRTHLKDMDVLLNITGASIGRCTYVPNKFGHGNVNQHVCIIRTGTDIFSPYLSYWLNSPLAQTMIFNSQKGETREGLNYSQLRSLLFPLCSLTEQNIIVQQLERSMSIISKMYKEIDCRLNDLKLLHQSLLKQAFEGKLVPQDPNDEPAEILLEKIKQEKQKIISQSKRGKK